MKGHFLILSLIFGLQTELIYGQLCEINPLNDFRNCLVPPPVSTYCCKWEVVDDGDAFLKVCCAIGGVDLFCDNGYETATCGSSSRSCKTISPTGSCSSSNAQIVKVTQCCKLDNNGKVEAAQCCAGSAGCEPGYTLANCF